MSEKWFIGVFCIFFVLALVVGTIQIHEAVKCGEKGGVYLTGKSTFPVCLKVETL